MAERTSGAAEQSPREEEVEGGEACYDAVVIGAGAAGLSAALVLGRSRRRVLILDGGEPRNAPSSEAHGFFTRDGVPPKELLRIGREQLTPYEGVRYRRAKARKAGGTSGAFEVVLEDGNTVFARRLILATGVVDELPDRAGFSELWGRGVYHCPYCHGWEVRDRPLAVLNSGPGAVERTVLIRNWSRDLVLLTDGPAGLDEKSRRRLSGLLVPVRELAAFEAEEHKSEDESYLSPAQPLVEPLSQRELEILQLIAQGLSNREISERLFLVLDTVKGHNRRIFGKLSIQRRTEAVEKARSLGILPRRN